MNRKNLFKFFLVMLCATGAPKLAGKITAKEAEAFLKGIESVRYDEIEVLVKMAEKLGAKPQKTALQVRAAAEGLRRLETKFEKNIASGMGDGTKRTRKKSIATKKVNQTAIIKGLPEDAYKLITVADKLTLTTRGQASTAAEIKKKFAPKIKKLAAEFTKLQKLKKKLEAKLQKNTAALKKAGAKSAATPKLKAGIAQLKKEIGELNKKINPIISALKKQQAKLEKALAEILNRAKRLAADPDTRIKRAATTAQQKFPGELSQIAQITKQLNEQAKQTNPTLLKQLQDARKLLRNILNKLYTEIAKLPAWKAKGITKQIAFLEALTILIDMLIGRGPEAIKELTIAKMVNIPIKKKGKSKK